MHHPSDQEYHEIRSLQRNQTAYVADLKRVYAAPTEVVALTEMDNFDEKFSAMMRKVIYTTNAIESLNLILLTVS